MRKEYSCQNRLTKGEVMSNGEGCMGPGNYSPTDAETFKAFAERTWPLPVGQGRLFWSEPLIENLPGMACLACRLPEYIVEQPKRDDLGDSYTNFMGMIAGDRPTSVHHPVIYLAFRFNFFSKPPLKVYEALNPADPRHNEIMRKFAYGPEEIVVLLIGPQKTDHLSVTIHLPVGHQKKLRGILSDFEARRLPSAPDFEAFARQVYLNGGLELQKAMYE